MDHGHFDNLARSAAAGTGTRRGLVRHLAGGALGSLVARIGLAESTEARAKRKRTARKPHNLRAERQQAGGLQTEGKRNRRKKHDKNDKKPKKKPPVCDNGLSRCPDGSCVSFGTCCPGSKRCADGFCHKEEDCCPEEKICDDGSCASQDACCPGYELCPDGGCVQEGECCIGEKRCQNGTCLPEYACCPDEPEPTCGVCEEANCVDGDLICQFQAGRECDTGYGTVGTCCGVFRVGAVCCPENSFCCPSFGCCPESLRGTQPNGAPCCKHPVNGYCISCYP